MPVGRVAGHLVPMGALVPGANVSVRPGPEAEVSGNVRQARTIPSLPL